jgi:hypothetical protein
MQAELTNTNLKTLTHAVELAAKVISKVTGEAIATTVNGEILTHNQIKQAVAAKMQAGLQLSNGV